MLAAELHLVGGTYAERCKTRLYWPVSIGVTGWPYPFLKSCGSGAWVYRHMISEQLCLHLHPSNCKNVMLEVMNVDVFCLTICDIVVGKKKKRRPPINPHVHVTLATS